MIKFAFVISVAFVCFDSGAAQRYRAAAPGYVGAAPGYVGADPGYVGSGSYQDPSYGKPMPYNFQYNTVDEYGTQLVRNEQQDAAGTVTGSYSYRDADGLYRIVDYVADKNGFRANIRTNEPGTAKDHSGDPADTNWEIEAPPANVIQKWAGKGGYQPGATTGRGGGGARPYAPLLFGAEAPKDVESGRYIRYPRY